MTTHTYTETTIEALIEELHAEDIASLKSRLADEVEMDRYSTEGDESC
jgi:hypothetical protein